MEPGTYNILVYERESLVLTFLLKDEDDTVFDLTGYTVKAKAVGTPDWMPAGNFDLAPSITDAEAGEITISRNDAQMGVLRIGTGEKPKWDMMITHTATAMSNVFLKGFLELKKTQTP